MRLIYRCSLIRNIFLEFSGTFLSQTHKCRSWRRHLKPERSTNKFYLWFFSQQKDVFDVFFVVDAFDVFLIENRTTFYFYIEENKHIEYIVYIQYKRLTRETLTAATLQVNQRGK